MGESRAWCVLLWEGADAEPAWSKRREARVCVDLDAGLWAGWRQARNRGGGGVFGLLRFACTPCGLLGCAAMRMRFLWLLFVLFFVAAGEVRARRAGGWPAGKMGAYQ